MRWHCVPLAGALVVSVGNAANAAAPPGISSATIPVVNCAYHLLKTNPAVQSVDVYAIDDSRSAVEYRFRGKDGNVIVADLMLAAHGEVTYDITMPRNESQEAGFESAEFLSSLGLSSKCNVAPVFDSVMPLPSPRADWRRIDWSNQPP
jgi:hypothetical protein